MSFDVPPLIVVIAAAVAAPVICELTRRIGLSVLVVELALGVAIGPHLLGWAEVTPSLQTIATMGMAFLFFLAGMEIDLSAIRGRPVAQAGLAWLVCIALGALGAAVAGHLGVLDAWLIAAICLSTTALGVLVPMLRDGGMLDTVFGRYVIAAGVVGELGPIILMTLFFAQGKSAAAQGLLVVEFAALVLVAAWALRRGSAVPRLVEVLQRTITRSSQLPVRLAVLLLAVLVLLAEEFGLDLALGALAAGMILRILSPGPHGLLQHKLDAIGFGLLIPIFFVVAGMKLDIDAVFADARGLGLTLFFFTLLLLTHVPMVLVSRRVLATRESMALGLFSATTLSLIVAMTEIALRAGAIEAREASPLVMAGVLSVVVLPLWASRLASPSRSPG